MSVLNESMSKHLLEKMILAAFNYGSFEDVDKSLVDLFDKTDDLK